MKLVLASSSPRRRELLASIGLEPAQILSPDIDESPLKQESICPYIERIARLKAKIVHEQVDDAYVLAADTAIELGGKIILKPRDLEDARNILTKLSGRRHRVYTCVCLISPSGREISRKVLTRLTLKRLSKDELDEFLASKEWEGKAGAFSIQGLGSKFVKFISGSYTNVLGLPLYETDSLLKGLGFRG